MYIDVQSIQIPPRAKVASACWTRALDKNTWMERKSGTDTMRPLKVTSMQARISFIDKKSQITWNFERRELQGGNLSHDTIFRKLHYYSIPLIGVVVAIIKWLLWFCCKVWAWLNFNELGRPAKNAATCSWNMGALSSQIINFDQDYEINVYVMGGTNQ